jgi:hypothetical protein
MAAMIEEAHPPTASFTLRRAQLFLTALWSESITVEPAALEEHGVPRLRDPDRLLCPPFVMAETARAAAAHAGAHRAFQGVPFSGADLKARQRALVEVVEDARVEALAVQRFPGLRRLWKGQLPGPDETVYDFGHLVTRLAHALLDPDYADNDAWVSKGQRLFFRQPDRWRDADFAYELGMLLASDLGQMRIAMNEGRAFSVASYRDDNVHLWCDERALSEGASATAALDAVGIRSARLQEDDVGTQLPLADVGQVDDGRGFALDIVSDDAALWYREDSPVDAEGEGLRYPEWDYRIECLKSDWATVRESVPPAGDAAVASRILASHHRVVDQLHRQIAAVRYESHRRLRHQLEGDELDPDGLVSNAIDLRARRTPDQRIYVRHHVHSEQELAALVLLDLSASTNDPLADDGSRTVLDVTRDAAVILSDALARLGHHFAIHGFNSDGRHAVNYRRFIDFDEPFGPVQQARFGGMHGEYSTRMGAAIRHATTCLAAQPAEHRLLLVITDGEPSDIDVHDRRMLIEDARHAVFDTTDHGVVPFCLSLDPRADAYVSHIFGPSRFTVLEHVADLPRRLPAIYFRLARRYLG